MVGAATRARHLVVEGQLLSASAVNALEPVTPKDEEPHLRMIGFADLALHAAVAARVLALQPLARCVLLGATEAHARTRRCPARVGPHSFVL